MAGSCGVFGDKKNTSRKQAASPGLLRVSLDCLVVIISFWSACPLLLSLSLSLSTLHLLFIHTLARSLSLFMLISFSFRPAARSYSSIIGIAIPHESRPAHCFPHHGRDALSIPHSFYYTVHTYIHSQLDLLRLFQQNQTRKPAKPTAGKGPFWIIDPKAHIDRPSWIASIPMSYALDFSYA